ncbi:MAG: hypothetical protein HS104_24960 [Polyangiaceae bacterium]|nr:hypothetical protein [Polyangiaceae bacterium]MCL4756692.1 hypothetical protein [Myxococcales bacterium]
MSNPRKSSVAIRFDLPSQHHDLLRHLVVSEHRPASELMIDAVELLLRYHGQSRGIPAPARTPSVIEEIAAEQGVDIEESSP